MAETPQPHGPLVDVARALAPFAPGVAGAVLGMMFAEGLTVRGKVLALVTGMASVIWIWPAALRLLSHYLFGGAEVWPELAGALGFIIGTFGMALLSGLAQAVAKYSRDPLKLVKIQAGPVTIGGGS